MNKPHCPEAFRKTYHEVDQGAFDDGRVCLLESGTECDYYAKYLAELAEADANYDQAMIRAAEADAERQMEYQDNLAETGIVQPE